MIEIFSKWWRHRKHRQRREQLELLRRSVGELKRNAHLVKEMWPQERATKRLLELVEAALVRLRQRRRQLLAR